MRKSLILLAATLFVAVGAAGTHRLRYDSSVFTGRGELTQTRPVAREYPPCIKGVREDRCIQLYERGVRRSYARWLAERGVTPRDRHASARAYPPCRSRSDDRCQQRSARNRVRTARAGALARGARRGQQRTLARSRSAVVRRAATSRTVQRRAAAPRAVQRRAAAARARTARRATTVRPPVRAAVRAPARATPSPARQAPRPSTSPTPPRQGPLPNTPGI